MPTTGRFAAAIAGLLLCASAARGEDARDATLPREELRRVTWTSARFTFRFSTDGVSWYRIGQDGARPRTVSRQF